MRISQGISIPGGLGRPFLPNQISGLVSWVRGDLGTRSAGYYSALTESGSVGGTHTGVIQPEDSVQFSDLKHLPDFRGTDYTQHSLAASSWSFLHQHAPYTVVSRVYLRRLSTGLVSNGGRICATFNTGASTIGMAVLTLDVGAGRKFRLYLGDGTSIVLAESTVVLTGGWYTVVTRSLGGGTYSISVNNETPVTVNLPISNAGAPVHSMVLGNNLGGAVPLEGHFAEQVIYNSSLSAAQLAKVRSYLASKWNSVPGVRLFLDSTKGITLNAGNVSAWADQAVGNSVTQGTAGAQPLYIAADTDFGGKPSIQGALGDILERATLLTGALAQPFFTAGVATWASAASSTLLDGQGATRGAILADASRRPSIFASSSTVNTATAPTAGTLTAVDGSYNGASSSMRARASGAAEETDSGDVGAASLNGLKVLADTTSLAPWGGKVALLVVVDHEPTTAGLAEIRAGLESLFPFEEEAPPLPPPPLAIEYPQEPMPSDLVLDHSFSSMAEGDGTDYLVLINGQGHIPGNEALIYTRAGEFVGLIYDAENLGVEFDPDQNNLIHIKALTDTTFVISVQQVVL